MRTGRRNDNGETILVEDGETIPNIFDGEFGTVVAENGGSVDHGRIRAGDDADND